MKEEVAELMVTPHALCQSDKPSGSAQILGNALNHARKAPKRPIFPTIAGASDGRNRTHTDCVHVGAVIGGEHRHGHVR